MEEPDTPGAEWLNYLLGCANTLTFSLDPIFFLCLYLHKAWHRYFNMQDA